MHRGRVSNELSEDGTVQRTVIALAPDKTDVTGEEGHEALLPMSHSAEINAAAAIEHMLRGGTLQVPRPTFREVARKDPAQGTSCTSYHKNFPTEK